MGVERIYPLHLPSITKIKISKSSKVKRAKLYYLREKKGKAGRLKEKGVAEDVIKFLAEQEKEEEKAKEQKVEESKVESRKEAKEEKGEKEKVKDEGKKEDKKKEKAGQKTQAEQGTKDSQDKS